MLLFTALPPSAGQSTTACETTSATQVTCRWTVDVAGTTDAESWEVPTFPLTLATINVALLRSPDIGWQIELTRAPENMSEAYVISQSTHPARDTTALRHEDSSAHVFDVDGGDRVNLVFNPGWMSGPVGGGDVIVGTGRFEVTYIASAVIGGYIPSRPAATQDDPQLPDETGEVEHDAWDLQAAWWDDADLADGLMEVRVKVVSLEGIPREAYEPPALDGVPSSGARVLQWKAAWTVLDTRYSLEWNLPRDPAPGDPPLRCVLNVEGTTEAEDVPLVYPLCTMDAASGVLSASFPLASIGTPPEGEEFQELAVRTRVLYWLTTDAEGPSAEPDVVDHAENEVYRFALGGPAVWSQLNGRLDEPAPSWYEAPLAESNADLTLQIVAMTAAAITFLVGLVLIWRRRRATSRLLARVDAIAEEHEDQRQALLALGRLEEEFAGMFRRHRISEGQYQVLSQRIATVATRYALRTALGLDDGVPGEASPTSVRVRRFDRP